MKAAGNKRKRGSSDEMSGEREAGKLPLYCIGAGQASCPGQPAGLAIGRFELASNPPIQ